MASKEIIDFVTKVESQNYQLVIDGNWVKLTPAPPTSLLMEFIALNGDELTNYLKERN